MIARTLDSVLIKLLRGADLTFSESREFFRLLFTGRLPWTKAKSFLLLLAQKGETADELLGCLRSLQALEKPIGPRIRGLMDTCGTGGDGRKSLNISTLVALVVAGAGGKIAKHGNRAISSRSGSSDLMQALGVRLDAAPRTMIAAVQRSGLGYFHAPFFHPVFAAVQPLRKAMKRPTILNLLGPLVNPMRLDHQLVGVSRRHLIPLYAKVLSKLGRKSALVCHSRDGLDEISTAAPTSVAWVTRNKIRMGVIQPGIYGLKKASLRDLTVDSIEASRRRSLKILTGKDHGPARDIVVLNAAFGLFLCDKAESVKDGIALARWSLDSGNALKVLKTLKKLAG